LRRRSRGRCLVSLYDWRRGLGPRRLLGLVALGGSLRRHDASPAGEVRVSCATHQLRSASRVSHLPRGPRDLQASCCGIQSYRRSFCSKMHVEPECSNIHLKRFIDSRKLPTFLCHSVRGTLITSLTTAHRHSGTIKLLINRRPTRCLPHLYAPGVS